MRLVYPDCDNSILSLICDVYKANLDKDLKGENHYEFDRNY